MPIPRPIPLAAIFLGLLTVLTPLHALPIKFLAWDDSVAGRKIGFMSGAEVVELQDLHPHKRTKTFTWTNGEVPPALVALDRSTPDGKPVITPLRFAAGLKSPLVLILPDPQHPTGLRGFIIEDGAASFAWGTLRFINATGQEILVRKDKEVKTLPNTWKPIDFSPGGGKRNIGIQMASRTDLNAVLYSSVWEHDPDVRKLIIVVPGSAADGGAVELKIIPEDRRSVTVARPAEQEP
jgi:hypothetical protein